MTKRQQILLIEDDPGLTALIVDELDSSEHAVATVPTLARARQWLDDNTAALVISDLQLPDGNGMTLIRDLLADTTPAQRPGIVVITAFGSVKDAVAALQLGADDFLTKPLDLDHFVISIGRVLERRNLEREVFRYRDFIGPGDLHGLLGHSQAMRQLREQLQVIARAQGPVLILGESGTGKELVARAIHAQSARADGSFIAVNCAGIPRDLLESEFFGHARGAFSGADRARKGLLLEADGGTLMLDEIGEMPQPMQARLLRALQDGSIRPVGQDTEVKVDVRVVAATHQNLVEKVRQGEFREDLYYRLEAFSLRVPPLREREDDVELLARHFVRVFALAQNKRVGTLTPAALRCLGQYGFPGNVRELRNIIERAVTFCDTASIDVDLLPERMVQPAHDAARPTIATGDEESLLAGSLLPTLEELQRRYARLMLHRVDGNKQRAAALLGIGRRTLYRWLDEEP